MRKALLKEDLEEKLLEYKAVFLDELGYLKSGLEAIYRKHGLPPGDDALDEEYEEWEEKADTVSLMMKISNEIQAEAYRFLTDEEGEDGNTKSI